MLRKLGFWGAALALAVAPVLSQAAMKGDPKAGQMKAALCEGCHGPGGNSPVATFPRLAGQYENYIAKQIHDFQKGLRANNATMAGMAATVASMQDAHDIGAYFQRQKMAKQPLVPVDKKKAAVGKRIFYKGIPEKDVYACVNCHGERGKGKAPHISVFPVIGGQHRDYIIKELKDFREGRRANDPAGMMADIARKLSDEEIEAVANYLSGLLP
ncbi:MAG: cytochrome c4 [Gammaproteobacteria bacterium]|nr:MAG: cytochrome c4 [Gammaproteobacteria bacterium]